MQYSEILRHMTELRFSGLEAFSLLLKRVDPMNFCFLHIRLNATALACLAVSVTGDSTSVSWRACKQEDNEDRGDIGAGEFEVRRGISCFQFIIN